MLPTSASDLAAPDSPRYSEGLLPGRRLHRAWPMTGIWVGGAELLADDGRRLAASLAHWFYDQRLLEAEATSDGHHVDGHAAGGRGSPTKVRNKGATPLVSRVQLFDQPGAVHDWPLMPWFDAAPGTAQRGMDELVDFVCGACKELLGAEPRHLVHR